MPKKQRIYSIKQNGLNDADRLELAKMLVKAGYSVRVGKERKEQKSKSYSYFVEYWEEDNE